MLQQLLLLFPIFRLWQEEVPLFSKFIEPIEQAVLLFPLVAMLFTLPYLFYEYRKYGALLFVRTVMVYSFVLYLMCAYFLIILPLPDPEKVAAYTSPHYQLIPFNDVVDIFRTAKVDWHNPLTYYKLIWNDAFFQVLFNILLTIPFGIYLRYFFHRSCKQTVLLSFLLSLFFEWTQLTGLYGIYPRPYRLADVCDLMTNTLGGFLGYLVAPKLTGWLPSTDRMKEVAYQRSKHVSILRRCCAAFIDCMLLLVLMTFGSSLWVPKPPEGASDLQKILLLFVYYTLYVLLYFGVLEWLLGGRSPGKLFLHLRLVDSRTMKRPKLWQCVVRYGIFYLIILPMPAAAMIMSVEAEGTVGAILSLLLLLAFAAFCIFSIIYSGVRGGKLPHAYFSKTYDISTLKPKPQKQPSASKTHAKEASPN